MPWAVLIIPLLCTGFLISSLSICQVLGLCPVLLESFSRSCWLSLHLQVSYLCSPEVSTLQNLHWSLWIDFCFEKEGDKDLVSFSYTWLSSFPSITCWRGCWMYVFDSLIVVVVWVYLGPLFHCIGQHICFWTNTVVHGCSVSQLAWDQTSWHTQHVFVFFFSAYNWFYSLGPFMLLFEFWFTNSVEMSLGFGWRMHWICLVRSVAATFRVPQSVHLLVSCFSGARKISLRSSITLLLGLFLRMLGLLWIGFFVKIY